MDFGYYLQYSYRCASPCLLCYVHETIQAAISVASYGAIGVRAWGAGAMARAPGVRGSNDPPPEFTWGQTWKEIFTGTQVS